jgi:hypothetical protein
MNYIEFKAGNDVYKLRLNTRAIVQLEKQLDCNPLAIFGEGDTIPTVTTMVNILHAAMQQYNHGITLNNAYDIFDKWLDDGNSTTDFITLILEIYKASGIIPNVEQVELQEKNA